MIKGTHFKRTSSATLSAATSTSEKQANKKFCGRSTKVTDVQDTSTSSSPVFSIPTGQKAVQERQQDKAIRSQFSKMPYETMAAFIKADGNPFQKVWDKWKTDIVDALKHPDDELSYNAQDFISGCGPRGGTRILQKNKGEQLCTQLTSEPESVAQQVHALISTVFHGIQPPSPAGGELSDNYCSDLVGYSNTILNIERLRSPLGMAMIKDFLKACDIKEQQL